MIYTQTQVPAPLGRELRFTYGSHFKYLVSSTMAESHVLAFKNKKFNEKGRFMEPQAPEMLTLDMVRGTRESLSEPASVLLSESTAHILFGTNDPVNQIVTLDNHMAVKVTGVYRDLPRNSAFARMGFMAPWELFVTELAYGKKNREEWNNNFAEVFAQIYDQTTVSAVSARIRNARLDKLSGEARNGQPAIFLDPMSRWYLYPVWKDGLNTGGRIQYAWLFAIVGAFVLFLACINFMNLSTARAEERAREVGVRKALTDPVKSLRARLKRQRSHSLSKQDP